MLHAFLSAHRADLIERCRIKVASRAGPKVIEADCSYGVPRFIDQLIETLQAQPERRDALSGWGGGSKSVTSEMGVSAARHGRELALQGFTVEQVIHDYGDLCQAITDAAFDVGEPIEVDEFRTLNRCLDNAIADSVTEWGYQNNLAYADKSSERVDRFVYQLRRLIHTATLAVVAIKAGNVGIAGATGAVLDRTLLELRNLLDSSIGDLRGLHPEVPIRCTRISVATFIAESKISAALEARHRRCTFTVLPVDPTLAVDVEEALLFAAVDELLDNALKWSPPSGTVVLSASASGDRIRIDVQDSCGGLSAGQAEKMLLSSVPDGSESAAGGLSECQRNVQANHGTLTVSNLPGSGCIFTINLPRQLFSEPVHSG
jgi:signal transduction histidine kinase